MAESDSPRLLRDEGPESGRGFKMAVAKGRDDEVCWLCGGPTLEIHCKIVCPQCGFRRDCSDP